MYPTAKQMTSDGWAVPGYTESHTHTPFRTLCKDGKERWIDVPNGSVELMPHPKIPYLLCALADDVLRVSSEA